MKKIPESHRDLAGSGDFGAKIIGLDLNYPDHFSNIPFRSDSLIEMKEVGTKPRAFSGVRVSDSGSVDLTLNGSWWGGDFRLPSPPPGFAKALAFMPESLKQAARDEFLTTVGSYLAHHHSAARRFFALKHPYAEALQTIFHGVS